MTHTKIAPLFVMLAPFICECLNAQSPSAREAKVAWGQGCHALFQGDHDLALTLFTDAHKLQPDNALYQYWRYFIVHKRDGSKKAAPELAKAIALHTAKPVSEADWYSWPMQRIQAGAGFPRIRLEQTRARIRAQTLPTPINPGSQNPMYVERFRSRGVYD